MHAHSPADVTVLLQCFKSNLKTWNELLLLLVVWLVMHLFLWTKM